MAPSDASDLTRAKLAVLEYLRPLLTPEQLVEASSRIARFAAEAVRRERRILTSAREAAAPKDPMEAFVDQMFKTRRGR